MAANLYGLRNVPRRTFRTRTPPDVDQNAIILAAASPDLESSAPSRDGWVLSDFYAFNHILKGLGSEQVWLTAASPTDVISRHGDYVHGNKVDENQMIVLSKMLIENDHLSPVTVIDPEDMVACYLYHVKKASAKAVRQNQPLLLMLFSIGFSETGFLMNAQNRDTGLAFEWLRDAISDGCRATLVSPNCFSGGWDVTDLSKADPARLDAPMLTTPHYEILSHAARMCGSIFAGPIIEALSSSSGPVHDIPTEGGTDAESLQPDEPTEEQEAAYHAFCTSVIDACTTGDETWDRHGFSFRAEDDHWSKSWTRSGKPLKYYEDRWNTLESPKYDTSSDERDAKTNDERISAMARLFMVSCPGDWDAGRNVGLHTLLIRTVKNPSNTNVGPYLSEIDPVALIRFRRELSHLADLLVRHFNLPMPNNSICVLWKFYGPQIVDTAAILDFNKHRNRAYGIFARDGLEPDPADAQGYQFNRSRLYLSEAVALTGGSEAEIVKLAEDMVRFVKKLRQFVTGPVLENHDVIDKRERWLETVVQNV